MLTLTQDTPLGVEGFLFRDLFEVEKLEELASEFERFVGQRDAPLLARFLEYRRGTLAIRGTPEESELLIGMSRHLSAFLARMFGVESEVEALRQRAVRDAEVAAFKKNFVSRRVAKVPLDQLREIDDAEVESVLSAIGPESPVSRDTDPELWLAGTVNRLKDPPTLDLLTRWAAYRWRNPSTRWNFSGWTCFRLPHPLHFEHLVNMESPRLRRRDGFELTDQRMTSREIADESHYCIYCHERQKDSCSRGFVEKAPPEAGPDAPPRYRLNPLGGPLHGCPLDERIGEMNLLRADGDSVAALAIVIIDNPMCPGTGHRICNDCMRSCIFQKQEPVNIPQVETGVLTDVLFLPYGFEIYSLLTRWNPLNTKRPVMRPYNGHNMLVVGLGPAGYTLAHYLANEGFGVVGIDGLKIEPLPPELSLDAGGVPAPIADMRALWERLDERLLAGFGGVSEYGITVRWDKNFLQCVRIALERRRNIRFYGGVRFGGTLTIEDAFDLLGFDHIAIAAGAGTPTIVRMKNNLIRGIRKASDFLMALQLTGAFKKNSMANLQVRLPAIVIGGGLTAIDTATELFAYYPIHVEKIAERYETLADAMGVDTVRAGYDAEELVILDEFLAHAAAVRNERERAAAAGEPPDFIPMVREWGGVTIAYRKSLVESPAYRLNYEEVAKAMEEGIGYIQCLSPVEAVADQFGHVKSILFEKQVLDQGRWMDSGQIIDLPARSVMVAAGTSPNVIYEKEHPGTFQLDSNREFFQPHRIDDSLQLIPVDNLHGPQGFFTSYRHPRDPRKLISFYGDNHPRYAGNVVKAMASARDGFPHVAALFDPCHPERSEGSSDRSAQFEPKTLRGVHPERSRRAQGDSKWKELVHRLDDALVPRVHEINRLTPTIVEVVVRAPFAAERFQPGQFYRLQNYESLAPSVNGTRLTMEGIALTGAWTDPSRGLLSLIILEMGGSSRLCAALRIGEPVVVMGPTGTPTEIPRDESVLLAGGGLGNAVLFSIARALRENGCRVVYFAGYKNAGDVFKQDEIEAGTDQVVWSVDRGEPIRARRADDLSFLGNIVQAIHAYASGAIGPARVPVANVSRVIAIGSDGMMRAVKEARHSVLAPYLRPDHVGIASINSPMQCMMKQVCAQCLQRHVDPKTGRETFVFSCFNQDQPMDTVDFVNLRARLRQNTVEEKLTNLWLTRLLATSSQLQS